MAVTKNITQDYTLSSTGVLTIATPTLSGVTTTSGDLKLGTAGNGLYIKEGTNATMGTAALTTGSVTVSTTKVTASSRIFLTHQTAGTLPGVLTVGTVTAATSFVINSTSATDDSTIAWLIVEPA